MRKFGLALAAGVLTAGLLLNPVAAMAQSMQEVCAQAQVDAQRDVNKTLWMAAGFFFGLLGIGAAYVLEPDPPASRLIGKSPEYVATYTDCYKEAGRDVQVKGAVTGCVIGSLLSIAWYGCCVVASLGT